MTNENIIKQLKRLIPSLQYADDVNAVKGAIQALSQINDIKAIINNPMYIQEDVLRYQMICEVVKE